MEKFYVNCISRDLYNYETYIPMENLKRLKEEQDKAKIQNKL